MSIPGILLTMLGHPLIGAAFFASEFLERKYPAQDPIDAQLAYEDKREKLLFIYAKQFKRWAFETDSNDLSNEELLTRWNESHGDIVKLRSKKDFNANLPMIMKHWYDTIKS